MIETLFLDVGGVLLTNGWDHNSRKDAVKAFDLDPKDFEERHQLLWSTLELGRLTTDEYLDGVLFYRDRPFSKEDFWQFMCAQSRPFPEMIDWVRDIKKETGIQIGVISNEGKDLTLHRFSTFGFREFIDFFVVSAFVQMRKPDPNIFQLALDVGQADPEKSVYIDDRRAFVDISLGFGIHGIHHTSVEETHRAFSALR